MLYRTLLVLALLVSLTATADQTEPTTCPLPQPEIPRIVMLRTQLKKGNRSIEITNPTVAPITFTLGLNDQIFESRQALLDAVSKSKNVSCKNVKNAKDLALPCAAYERVASWIYHYPELTDQTDLTGWLPFRRLWAESPLLAINSFGFGSCGTFADVLAKIWSGLGYDVRRRDLNGHSVTEVRVGDRWVLFDADLRGFFSDKGQLLGVDQLLDQPTLANTKTQRPLPGERALDFPRADLYFYPQLMASSAQWRAVTQIPTSAYDWQEPSFTIPPGGRLVLPVSGMKQCLFPEHERIVDKDGHGGFTDPTHQYAVLTLPAGSTSTVTNGLFAGQIIGDYKATIEFASGTTTTTDFDEMHRFRYARRFARKMTIEAHSAVSIYYLVSAQVELRSVNEVRLYGEHADYLQLRMIGRDRANISPKLPPHPCKQTSPLQKLSILKVSATSNSYDNEALSKNLVDGETTQGWTSGLLDTEAPQEIILDLGKPMMVGGVRWAPSAQYGMLSPSSVEIDTALQLNRFRQEACVTDYQPESADWVKKEFHPRLARYVRLTLTPVPHFLEKGHFQVALGEIEVLR